MASAFRLRAAGAGRQDVDAAEVRRALALLADPAAGVELRGLPSGRSRVLPGSDLDGLVRAAGELADDIGIYYALNPVPPDLGRAARVGDVLRRRWLLVDIDPIRPVEASATDVEKAAARTVCVSLSTDLTGVSDWPAPIVVDSGNGYHLLWRIDLPNDEESRGLLRACLKALAAKYDTPGAVVDTAVHNASRIAKLPGTWARKGPAGDDRPHRRASVLSAPESPGVVPVDRLRQLAGVVPQAVPQIKPPPATLPFTLRATGDEAMAYVRAAIEGECADVAAAGAVDPGRNNVLNAAAYSLGQLVGGGVADRADVEAALYAAAVRCGLETDPNCGKRGIRATIQSGLTAGMEKPRGVPGRDAPGHTPPSGGTDTVEIWTVEIAGEVVAEGKPGDLADLYAARPRTGRRMFEVVTLDVLMARDLPEPNWAVPGLLAEGLNLLAGAPKQGKSIMALNLAMTVAGGGKALGSIQVHPGDVLYLSLEDKQRRVKFRAQKMAAKIPGAGKRLAIVTEWPRMDQGGLGLLAEWVRRVEHPTLVIVDVLQKFRPRIRERGSLYEQDSEHLYAVKGFADDHRVTALVLHHTRKAKADDPLETISGTTGLTGACDGYAVLDRVRQSNEATIFFEGRDAGNQKLALQFDPEALVWESLGPADEHLSGRLQQRALDYLKGRAGQPVFARDVADHLGEDTTDKIRPILHKLMDKGFIGRRNQAWIYPGAGEGGDVQEF